MEIIKAYPGELINIGRKGENLARQVQIDLTEWVEKYGDGKAELLYQRPQDVIPYPVPIERQGNSILWTITNTDTAQAGRTGRAEIRYYVDAVLVILEISYIVVENTLENPGELPEPPGQSWFDQMLEQVKRVNAPSLNAPILNEETGTWMIWSQVTERYENTNFPATGPRGEQGPDPDLRIKAVPVSGGTRLDFSYMRAGEGVGESLIIRDGRNGEDGLTPEIDISQEYTAEGSTVFIKVKTGDKQDVKYVRIKNGKDGKDGAPGSAGQPGKDGGDGTTPHIGENGHWWIGDADTGIAATGPEGPQGIRGLNGNDGVTPHIGENGNWFIGDTDTGVAAQGPAGSDATVTADNIKSALGYTPANADDIVQADFEENNPESPAFIQNRTHWKETEIGAVLFEKSDLTSAAYDLSEAIGLEEGQRYDVTYIGTVSDHFYETKPVPYVSDVDDTERGLILVLDDGNVRNQKTTGLPFAFVEYDAATVAVKGVHGFAIQQDGSTTASLTIGGHRTTWHKLERGYLPDDLGDVKSVNGARPDEAGNVSVDVGVKTINGKTPDEYGNVKIETGGGATVQADFGENDPTAAGYIRNRTHWMEKIGVEGEIIKTSVSYLAAGSKTVAGSIANGLEEGGRYTVTWRGVTYMCVCALHNGTAYIGNSQMMDDAAEASDYPFCICGNGEKYKIYSSSLGSIAVEVVGEPEIIYHKLDKAYLPDDIGGGDNMFFVHASVETEEDGTKKTIVDKSLADIDQAITDGKVVYARYVSDDVIMMPFVARSEHGALFGACAGSNRVISVYYLIMYEYGGGKVGVVSVPTEGVDGKDGADGITPHIGDNGNWYLGEIDTGVAATGPAGPAGAPGKDGADGQRGTGTLKVTTQPSSYTTAIGDYVPKYRIALATVISQSKKTEVLLGDLIQYSYYQYQVDYLDDTYAYISATRVSIRGATGAEGAAGATGPQGPAGPAGSDANVTAENIKSALGYTPADAADLTQLNNEKIADYVVAEAKEVAQKIVENRTINSLVLLMATDLHVSPVEATRTAIKHMGQGMDKIRDHITPDAVVLLGDYNYGATPQSTTQGIEDMMLAREYVADATKGIPTVWMNGNHDYYAVAENEYKLSDNAVYALVGSHNTQTVVDTANVGGNYGYIDFEKQKIRLIYLNTTDINGVSYTSHRISNEQGAWFINTALDLSGKGENEENWGIVVCTHIPVFSNSQLTGILGNYADRTGGSAYGTAYSFANAKAQIIATFHGHVHNLKVTDMTTPGGSTIKAICIPNAVPNRENPYTGDLQEVDANGNPVAYPKTVGTAEDTSFNAVIIDRDNNMIHAICYGAGYDREIEYENAKPAVVIINQIPISTDASGAVYNGTGFKDGVRIGSDGSERTGATVDVTGFIPCTKADTLYFQNCQITVGTGNYQEINYYDSNKTYISKTSLQVLTESNASLWKNVTLDENGYLTRYNMNAVNADTAFVRISGDYIGADSIITVNQPIE